MDGWFVFGMPKHQCSDESSPQASSRSFIYIKLGDSQWKWGPGRSLPWWWSSSKATVWRDGRSVLSDTSLASVQFPVGRYLHPEGCHGTQRQQVSCGQSEVWTCCGAGLYSRTVWNRSAGAMVPFYLLCSLKISKAKDVSTSPAPNKHWTLRFKKKKCSSKCVCKLCLDLHGKPSEPRADIWSFNRANLLWNENSFAGHHRLVLPFWGTPSYTLR